MIKDLTKGSPSKVLIQFSIPMFISVIFQQMYSLSDSIIAGKFAGENALAAVGASYPITMIFMAIAFGSNIGCSVIISQLFGRKEYAKCKTAISTTLIATLVLSLILTIIGLLISDPMMRLIQTPADIFKDSSLFFKIYIGGFAFLFLYNVATGVFTSLGDSNTPLYFLIGSSVGNILLCLLFVGRFHFGVAGVAWATFIAQGIACILSLITLVIRLRQLEAGTYPRFSFPVLWQIARVAIPSILQQSFVSVGNIFVQNIINSYGTPVIAGFSAAMKLNTFAITSLATLANGMSSFTAQNVGARDYNRIKKGFHSGVGMVLAICVPFVISYTFFGSQFISIFKVDSSLGLKTGIQFLQIVSPFYFIISVKLLADGVLRGTGSMGQFMVATFTDLILRVAFSYILAPIFGTNGIWASWPIGWIAAAILSLIFYFNGRWKETNVLRD